MDFVCHFHAIYMYISWFIRIGLPRRIEQMPLIKKSHSDVVFAQTDPLANTGRTLSALPPSYSSLSVWIAASCLCMLTSGAFCALRRHEQEGFIKIIYTTGPSGQLCPMTNDFAWFLQPIVQSLYKNLMSIMRTKCRNFANNCCRAKQE